jgi:hypothetical protein
MDSAKRSFTSDIKAGFQIIHIDPSIDPYGDPTSDEVLERLFELYEYCWNESLRLGKDVIFEVGTEEQSGATNTQDELEYTLHKIFSFAKKNNIPHPKFVVVQTGTRVVEMRNVGSMDSPVRVTHELPAEIQVPQVINLCRRYGVLIKEHNADYLSDETLRWHPRLGIHAANVAPEFGVTESRALLEILEYQGMHTIAEKFLALSLKSGKWQKWMVANTKATERDKAIIAGHYIFSKPEFVELKKQAEQLLFEKGLDLDLFLKNKIKASIMRYMKNFRLA